MAGFKVNNPFNGNKPVPIQYDDKTVDELVKNATGLAGGMVAGPPGAVAGGNLGKNLDIGGSQAAKQQADTASQASSQQASLDAALAARPQYNSIQKDNGELSKPYRMTYQDSNLGGLKETMAGARGLADPKEVNATSIRSGQDFLEAQSAANKLDQRAFGTGPSAWAQSRMDLADNMAGGRRDAANKDSARSRDSAMSMMAAQGGIGGGSRERMAKNSNRDAMFARQDIARDTANQKLGISAEDEAQRLQLQQSMPGMRLGLDSYKTGLDERNMGRDIDTQKFNVGTDMQQGQYNSDLEMRKAGMWGQMAADERGQNQQVEATNIQNKIGNVYGGNAYDLDGWKTGVAAQGSNAAANAIMNSGGGGGGFLNPQQWFNYK